LKVIFKLSLDEAATPTSIARARGVSQAAASKMIGKLRGLKLVAGPAAGVTLTASGRKVALETIRHHRLLEVYLKEALGYSWDRVDAEAEELEHFISEEFEERIDRLLGHPTHDPHGAPIPRAGGRCTARGSG
jgi:DtxR family Mn-dependent transcriptional regulator